MILEKLSKRVIDIDKGGIYPKDIMQELAKDGFFKLMRRDEILDMILNISKVSKICGTTGFCVWCQYALIWYILNSKNETLKERYLKKVANGEILGGTGLSNAMKGFAGIEKVNLKATKTADGYLVNGTLPWVSNIERNHLFAAVALDEQNKPIMGLFHTDERVVLKDSIKYEALDGSATKSVVFRDYHLKSDEILADGEIYSYLLRINPGFILLQTGIAKGIIESSLEIIENSNKTHGSINSHLPDSKESLEKELEILVKKVANLAKNIDEVEIKDILKVRLDGSLLCSKATHSAVLHAGTRGYFKNSKTQRIQRESNFVSIVTPSVKHLMKELNDIENGLGCAKAWQNLASKKKFKSGKEQF